MKRKKDETDATHSSAAPKGSTPVSAQNNAREKLSKPSAGSANRQAIFSQIAAAIRAGAPIMASIRTFSDTTEFGLTDDDKQALITAACQARVRFVLEAAKQDPLAWLRLVEPGISDEIEWLDGKTTGEKLLNSPIFVAIVNMIRPTLISELGEIRTEEIINKIIAPLNDDACLLPSSSIIKENKGSKYAGTLKDNP